MVIEDDIRCSMCNKVICHSLSEGYDYFIYPADEGWLVFCWECETKYNRNVPT